MEKKSLNFMFLFFSIYIIVISIILSGVFIVEVNVSLFILSSILVLMGLLIFFNFRKEIVMEDRDLEKEIKSKKRNNGIIYPTSLPDEPKEFSSVVKI